MEGRTVGIGLDYSPSSKWAVRWVVEQLARDGDRVVLIHSQPGKPDDQFRQGVPALISLKEFSKPEVQEKYRILPDAYMLHLLNTVSKTKGVEVTSKFYRGDPRDNLVAAVDDLHLDAIVVGSRGLGTVKSLLLGSVSAYVVKHARCPVTVVKGLRARKHRRRSCR